jgi:hypothetical protein
MKSSAIRRPLDVVVGKVLHVTTVQVRQFLAAIGGEPVP